MNLVYLHSHDTGRYIQPYGHSVETPSLQRLAEQGVVFRNAHCAAPTCSPSRAALLTGQSAHATGMVALAHRGGVLRHPERHLAAFLGRHGYETVRAGIEHVGYPPVYTRERQGNQGAEAADFAARYLEARPKGPFFLDVGFVETHRLDSPYAGAGYKGFSRAEHSPRDGESDARWVAPPALFPDNARTRRDWADYRVSARRLDGYYGRILEALDGSGLAGETLVLVTTDHGIAFPDMKCSLTQHGTGVLFMMRGPAGFEGGRVVDGLVSHLDFFPTFCELAGLERPGWLEGAPLGRLARGEAAEVREEAHAEVTFHGGFEPKRSVRTARWNYIRNFAGHGRRVMVNCDDSITKSYWAENGWREGRVAREELYDLALDPQERHNLAGAAEHAAVLEEMRGRLRRWMERTSDPILERDPGGLPPGLTVNRLADFSPEPPGEPWERGEWAGLDRG